jgi:undecaprenyl-diphosphatase
MTYVTNFGDQAVILPVVLAVGIALQLGGWSRGAAAWITAIAATLLAVLLAKILVHACGLLSAISLRSPSGHTAASAVVYGGLVGLISPPSWRPRLAGAAAAIVAAVVIGISRLALGMHSYADVLVGGLMGVAGAGLLVALAGDQPLLLRRTWPIAAAIAMVLLFQGAHLNAETGIHRLPFCIWPLGLCLCR